MSESFLEALAEPRPDPGGGAAAAYVASVACALMIKIVRLEIKRHPENCQSHSFWTRLLAQARRLAEQFDTGRKHDVRAYLEFTEARKQGNSADELSPFILDLVKCPEQIMRTAQQALLVCSEIGRHCRRHLIADLHVAQELLGAALHGAFQIACANLPLIERNSQQQFFFSQLSKVLDDGLENFKHVREILASRIASPVK